MTVTGGLQVRDLSVSFVNPLRGSVQVLKGVSFSVNQGEAVGLVGESGSGKSLTSLAVMGLLPANANLDSGDIIFEGEDLLAKSDAAMRRLRGGRLSMVLQDPATSLDPSFTIGDQIREALWLHRGLRGRVADRTAIAMLERVRIPSAEFQLRQYPHQLSGGMRQRVCSAIALAGEPRLLIADEPTTALDVTTQAQYLSVLRELKKSTGFALLLITHDLSVIRHMCDRVIVMYAGEVVEEGPLAEVIGRPQHPYTKALFETIPGRDPTVRLRYIRGQAPDPQSFSKACRFAPRCDHAREACSDVAPDLTPRLSGSRSARCHGTKPGGWIGWS
jgi:peptide/nickel transport system ATP-binding protein